MTTPLLHDDGSVQPNPMPVLCHTPAGWDVCDLPATVAEQIDADRQPGQLFGVLYAGLEHGRPLATLYLDPDRRGPATYAHIDALVGRYHQHGPQTDDGWSPSTRGPGWHLLWLREIFPTDSDNPGWTIR